MSTSATSVGTSRKKGVGLADNVIVKTFIVHTYGVRNDSRKPQLVNRGRRVADIIWYGIFGGPPQRLAANVEPPRTTGRRGTRSGHTDQGPKKAVGTMQKAPAGGSGSGWDLVTQSSDGLSSVCYSVRWPCTQHVAPPLPGIEDDKSGKMVTAFHVSVEQVC
ncbi:hypothetical protein K504DRAFT_446856 [Pleomassaria siparia CBS 279.74]|uniref:Uncharacterized protein n=1 Tax=Pleomassaria siparia CBS 279.74 TaxID=1314801 RepID=A0A6G1K4L1_9PLEO|nr:hypothetical protein K504DRAFT_446856 [Pleomassaria siparia CBS 279.74]